MNYKIINNNQSLKEICAQASTVNCIALDTEFIRTRSYYPQLGLIQLYTGDVVTLIDPLGITDWSAFKALLLNPNVTKLLHACSEDLDVFMYQFGLLPSPLMDTQIVAAFVGHPISCGFAALVAEYSGVELDKSESRTDWLARPLSDKQCIYAAADVFYLLPLAGQLLQKAHALNWIEAIHEEIALQCQRKQKTPDPTLAYLSITNAWQLKGRQLACLQKLAEWRFNYARSHDIALNFVVREEALWQIASTEPSSLSELNLLGLKPTEIRLHGKTLLNHVQQVSQISADEWPAEIVRVIDTPGYKQKFKKIKERVNELAVQNQLKAELIASRRQIDQFLKWRWLKTENQPDLISGWRERLLAGQLDDI